MIYLVENTWDFQSAWKLKSWLASEPYATGLLCPVINGRRMFFDIRTEGFLPFEFSGEDPDGREISTFGNLKIYSDAYQAALLVLERELQDQEFKFLIIDPVGPAESVHQGFSDLIKREADFFAGNLDQHLVLLIEKGFFVQVKQALPLEKAEWIDLDQR